MPEAKAYRTSNLILAGIFSLVFIYSAVFSYEKENHPIPSFHTVVTGEPTLSTGLSRSFSAIVRLEFDIAHQFNPYGLLVFIFFLEQFLIRLALFFLIKKWPDKIVTFIICDALLLISGFIIHFKPFLLETFYR